MVTSEAQPVLVQRWSQVRPDLSVWAPPLITFLVYLMTVPPGVMVWDTGEAQTVPYIAGIFHPSGSPVNAMAGWVFSHLFAIGNVAWRMNVFAALCGAVSVALLIPFARGLGVSPSFAALGGLLYGVAPAVWVHSTRAAVEPLAAVLIEAALLFALRESLVGVCLCAGLALGAHPFTIWLWPGLWLVALRSRIGKAQGRPEGMLAILACLLLGIGTYWYIPIRANMLHGSSIEEVADFPLPSQPIWGGETRTTAGLLRWVSAADYSPQDVLASMADPAKSPAFVWGFLDALFHQYNVALLLAPIGIYALRKQALLNGGLLLAAFGIFPYAASYAWNLPYASKYYMPGLWVVAAFIGLGATVLARAALRDGPAPAPRGPGGSGVPFFSYAVNLKIGAFHASSATALRREGAAANAAGERTPAVAQRPLWIGRIAPVLVACALVLDLLKTGDVLQQKNEIQAYQVIDTVRNHTPDDAVVLTQWWFVTALYYAKYIDESMGHRIIVSAYAGSLIDIVKAHPHDVYLVQMLDSDIKIPHLRFEKVPDTWPGLYHVLPG